MVTPRTPELAEALALIAEQASLIKELRAELSSAHERIAELEKRLEERGKKDPPSFVKPNRPRKTEGEKKPRKKRTENHARKLEEPTEEVIHAVETCPDCGRRLRGGWEFDRRQVIDIPQTRYIVRDHVRLRRYCGVCQTEHLPKVDLSDEVVGKQRVSIRVMALVTYLRIERRVPLSGIQQILRALYGLELSEGALTRLCDATAKHGRRAYEGLRDQLRSSPVVHADETGWREDGQNGWFWAFLTSRIQFFHRDASRASAIPEDVLGAKFAGILVSDFYSGYSPLVCEKQRCWAHLLRDLAKLEEAHPGKKRIANWTARIRALYKQAAAYRSEQQAYDGEQTMGLRRARMKARRAFERAALKLARRYLKKEDDPRHVLAERIERFRFELFTFVEHPEAPPDNNAAERGLRPSVIARKISGGTRSERGSETMAILRSLFGTWRLQGKPPLQACLELLASAPA